MGGWVSATWRLIVFLQVDALPPSIIHAATILVTINNINLLEEWILCVCMQNGILPKIDTRKSLAFRQTTLAPRVVFFSRENSLPFGGEIAYMMAETNFTLGSLFDHLCITLKSRPLHWKSQLILFMVADPRCCSRSSDQSDHSCSRSSYHNHNM